ncbi:MAG: Methyltransferase type 11 [Cyanobacteria bacterium RYN_339]|nr:Methyltransferase type 11 [Cyanobacteria bacterium RYN_339]
MTDSNPYYDRNARAFYDTTVDVALDHLYAPFLALLPPGAKILDAGCGSGRDALRFKQQGHVVTLVEPSLALAELAAELVGQEVLALRFQDLSFDQEFDGAWASASLLHVPRSEIDDVLARLWRALRPGGILYASFKHGEGERFRNGRFFNSYTEASFAELIARHPGFEPLTHLLTEDVRTTHRGEVWLNVLLRRSDQGDHLLQGQV